MTTIDLDALIAALDPGGRGGRRHADEVAAAIRALAPHLSAAEVPELVADTIRRGEAQGRWNAARTTTALRGRTTLPKSVTIPSTRRPADRRVALGVPLRNELAGWAATLRLSAQQRQLLLAVNDWLRRTNGGDVPVIAAAERAYELTGDEKAFDNNPPRGGAQLWGPGRLTFGLLRCERTPTPLTWEPVRASISVPGSVLCVENHATFRTMLRGPARPGAPPVGRGRMGTRTQHRASGIAPQPALPGHPPRLYRRPRRRRPGDRRKRVRRRRARRHISRTGSQAVGAPCGTALPPGQAGQRT
jgi:hypothetical protein